MKTLRYWLIRKLGGYPPLELRDVPAGLNVWKRIAEIPVPDYEPDPLQFTFVKDLQDSWSNQK